MTEQSKIPVPKGDEKPDQKEGLLEKSLGDLDINAFKPAPVPADLIAKANRSTRKKKDRKAVAQAAAATSANTASHGAMPVTAPAAEEKAPPPKPAEKPVDLPKERQTIDRAQLSELGMIEPDGAVSALLEEFRIIKRQVLQGISYAQTQTPDSGKAQRVLVCSPHSGEGKTFCAINLALAIAAEREAEVVLVDADLAKPSILSTLGLSAEKGLMDAIVDPSVKVENCVVRTDVPGLFVLPSGSQVEADSEYLASERTTRVLERLTRGAPNRVIIFDSPPALAASPAAELAKHVSQALLIARADRTGQSALEDAVQLLSNCPDIKLILNGAHFSPSGRRFGSYYGYGG